MIAGKEWPRNSLSPNLTVATHPIIWYNDYVISPIMNKQNLTKQIVHFAATFILTVALFISFVPQKEVSIANTKGTTLSSSTTQNLPYTSNDSSEFEITNFSIAIPKIGLDHNIFYNVDPREKDIYLPILDEYVAHGKFTALPSTAESRVYLFAHSKKAPKNITPEGGYFSHIHTLKKGDKIIIKYNDQTFTYEMRERIIVEPTQVDVYTGNSDKVEVALQTCYPPGTTEKRLIVFADLISVK
jgi:LPXTG-site transpeptidase (sortase) family protein